jgi:WD40 repeat protein
MTPMSHRVLAALVVLTVACTARADETCMLIAALSNSQDQGGRTALVEYNNDGKHIRTLWLPEGAEYGYDVRVQPRLNRMLTSSFTGHKNYMMDLGTLLADTEAMKRFGNTMVVWDFHARKPVQTLEVPGAPLEIRWALLPRHNYAFTSTALTSKLWLIAQQPDGTFKATAVADIGDPTKTPLPVDISLSADDHWLFVTTFMDGTLHVFDVSDPAHPKQVGAEVIGKHLHRPRTDWAFATAPDEARLAPLLADFGQTVAPLRFDDGRRTGLYRHVLKVFLVDRQHRVRNVYSTGFLDPELILNDVRTVLLDADR